MQIGDIGPFKKSIGVFCVIGGILLVADFGSYYAGRYGLSGANFTQDGLWWVLFKDTASSVGPALGAAVGVYLGARKKSEASTSNGAA